jgi:DNA ligase (NAD+)
LFIFFENTQNQEILKRLKQAGVHWGASEKGDLPEQSKAFSGMKFVFTGALSSFTRKEAEEEVIQRGGEATSSVSKNTSYVVAGEDAGSKLEKARKLNIPVLNESEFMDLINKE